jgi:hypothetical protein
MEIGHVTINTAVANFANPIGIARPASMSTFTTSDDPMNIIEVQLINRSKQWLGIFPDNPLQK